jgi:hypothetical protein
MHLGNISLTISPAHDIGVYSIDSVTTAGGGSRDMAVGQSGSDRILGARSEGCQDNR